MIRIIRKNILVVILFTTLNSLGQSPVFKFSTTDEQMLVDYRQNIKIHQEQKHQEHQMFVD